MSEYQYYEFLAIDRPLTAQQLREVRQFSTRADITPTHFVNTYNYGDFHGNPDDFVTRFFDLMLYVANWGTRRLLIGLPASASGAVAWRPFASEGALELRSNSDRLLVDFDSNVDEPEDDFDEGTGWLASLAPIRAELLAGDLRPLYIAWLAGAQDGTAGRAPPPPPPGLARLTPAQQTLAEFLRVDQDLLAAAAADSAPLQPSDPALADWITSLPQAEKDRILLDIATGRDPHAGPKLLRRHHASTAALSQSRPTRPVASLRQSADALRTSRLAAERKQADRDRARRQAEEAAAREQRLQLLRADPEAAWRRVEQILTLKESASYDQAAQTLSDLREIARRDDALPAFAARLTALHRAHRRKHSFTQRLRAAHLLGD